MTSTGTPTPDPASPRKRHWARNTLIAAGGLITLIAGVSVAAGGGNHTSPKTSAPASSEPATAPAAPVDTPAPAGTPPAAALTGPVGTTYTVTYTDVTTGSDATYAVVLTKVNQAAVSASEFSAAPAGQHLAAAGFSLIGETGTASSNANNNAVAVGTDGQDYTFSTASVTDGTNFNYGNWVTGAGQVVRGWVSFQLPDGVSIAAVQWSHGFGGDTSTWTVR